MKAILLGVLLLASGTVSAGGTVVLHLGSRHANPQGALQESNTGVGFRYDLKSGFLMAGEYLNSMDRTTLYAGAGYAFYDAKVVSARILGVVATGYETKVIPAVVPEISIRYLKTEMLLSYIPKISYQGNSTFSTFTLSLGLNF